MQVRVLFPQRCPRNAGFLPSGVIGNTPEFGSGESEFEPSGGSYAALVELVKTSGFHPGDQEFDPPTQFHAGMVEAGSHARSSSLV